jgi:hypothetical protein
MPVTCVDLSHYQAGFNFDQFKAGGGFGVIPMGREPHLSPHFHAMPKASEKVRF